MSIKYCMPIRPLDAFISQDFELQIALILKIIKQE